MIKRVFVGGDGERLSDTGAREILKTRKSSIFPVPCREAVYAETYEKACEVNERLTGKHISKQAWKQGKGQGDRTRDLLNITSPGPSLIHRTPVTDRLKTRKNLEECFRFYGVGYSHTVQEKLSSPAQCSFLGGYKQLVPQFSVVFEEFERKEPVSYNY